MKPFSPLYFIRQNTPKCILLIFMLFLGYGAYLGGLYVTNPVDNFNAVIEDDDKYVHISVLSGKDAAYEVKKKLAEYENVQVIETGSYNNMGWKTIMGFKCWSSPITFLSVEDLKLYFDCVGIECDTSTLTEGSIVMSELFAKNRGLNIGDKVDESIDEELNGEFVLKALTKQNGYTCYFIADEGVRSYGDMLLLGKNGADGIEMRHIANELSKDFNIFIYSSSREEIEAEFRTFNMIYFFIMILLGVILAVTINAAFVGMYQRRNFEFAVYRAIGVSRRRIIGKIIGELLCMDFIALTAGGAVFFFGLYLFNNLALYPNGLYLRYFHPLALMGTLICNITVLIPLFVTRCRQMLKADICEY